MKLLVVIPTYEPAWAAGGAVTATANLCRALARKGVEVTVYTTNADGKGGRLEVPISKAVEVGGVKVWYFSSSLGQSGFYSRDLAGKLKETVSDFDLVHVSAIWQWLQVDVSRICMAYKVPYVVSPHGSLNSWAWSQKTFKKKIYWALFGRRTLLNASAIHFTVRGEQEQTLAQLPELAEIPGFIVPNGIQIPATPPAGNARSRLGIAPDRIVLLYAGRIHRKKGIHLVVEAMKKLGDKRLMLLLVGPEEDLPYCQKLQEISTDIPGQVEWIGQVPADEVWAYYRAADLFVLPSYDENFGMVVVEAMLCGLPVMISKNVGIWAEIQSSGAGFIVNCTPADIAGVAGKLLSASSEIKGMAEKAQKFAKNYYDIDAVADRMEVVYKGIVSNPRRVADESQK